MSGFKWLFYGIIFAWLFTFQSMFFNPDWSGKLNAWGCGCLTPIVIAFIIARIKGWEEEPSNKL